MIIGAGFGWLAEELSKISRVNIAGTDTSLHIQNNKDVSEEAEITNVMSRQNFAISVDTILGPNDRLVNPLDVWLRRNEDGSFDTKRTSSLVVAEDGKDGGSRTEIKNLVDGLDMIFTDNVISGMDDSEVLQFLDSISLLKPDRNTPVYHYTTPKIPKKFEVGQQDKRLNWKTFPEWRKFLDSNGFSDHKLLSYRMSEF